MAFGDFTPPTALAFAAAAAFASPWSHDVTGRSVGSP